MPKHKLTELDELLAKSRRLNSHFGDEGLFPKNVIRGVAELNEASRQLAQPSSSSSSRYQENYSDAYLLLSERKFDAKKLQENVNSLKLKSTEDKPAGVSKFDSTSLADEAHRRNMNQIFGDQDERMKKFVEFQRKKWRNDQWDETRKQYLDKLKHQLGRWEGNYGYAAPPSKDSTNIYAGGMTPSTPAKSSGANVNNSLLMTPASPFNLSALMTRPTPANYSATPLAAPNHYAMTPGTSTVSESLKKLLHRPLHSQLLQAHTAVVRAMQLQMHSRTPSAESVFPCKDLSEAISVPPNIPAKTLISDGLTKSDLFDYKTLLDLLSSIVGEPTGEAITPGFFSSICFEEGEVLRDIQESRRKTLTLGAKQHLESQMAEIWSRAVDTAVFNRDLVLLTSNEGTSRQQRLRSYVSYQFRIGAIPALCGKVLCPVDMRSVPISASSSSSSSQGSQFNVTSTPLWAFIYHCLRVGDLVAALAELNKCVSAGFREGEQYAATSLRLLSQFSSTGDCSSADLHALLEAMTLCTNIYSSDLAQEEEQAGNSAAVDPYRLMVFNLLGLSDRDGLSGSAIPGFGLEDFLWSQLWFVHMARLVSERVSDDTIGGRMSSTLAASSSLGFNASNRAGELEFFELIEEYGAADYFDQDRSTPFKYAKVLLCCQRFGDAIAHLWSTGKTVPAIHLAEICLYYGLILPHQPLTQNPRTISRNNGSGSNGDQDSTTPSSMLQVFLNTNIFLYYPEAVIDYLIGLNTNWLSFAAGLNSELKEVHRLKSQGAVTNILEMYVMSLDKDCLSVVVGTPADPNLEGVDRSTGRLDDYLDRPQVNLILCRSAYHLLTARTEAESAIYLYQLAGRYGDVLNEMCVQLSSYLIPPSLSYVHKSSDVPEKVRDANLLSVQHVTANQKAAREHWRQLAAHFVERHLQVGSKQHTALVQSGHGDLAAIISILLKLYPVVDAYVSNDFQQCLHLLDEVQLLPVKEEQVDQYLEGVTRPHISGALDDLLIIAMESSRMLHQHTKATRLTLAGTPYKQSHFQQQQGNNLSLLTVKDAAMQSLLQRAKALVVLAGKIKAKLLRPETSSILGRIEASFM